MGSGFGGMLFLTGWMIDHYSYHPVFFMFGILPTICAFILWFWLGLVERGAVKFSNHKSEEKAYVTSN
jgi:hypothetical protein